MFESYIRGVFYYNYLSCHQLHTVALSFLPYAAGKQQLEGKMPKIAHFHFTNRSQRDNHCFGRFQKTRYNVPGLFCVPKAFKTFKEWWNKTKKPEIAEKAKTIILQKLRESQAIVI